MGNWNRVIWCSAGELSAWWPKLAAAATRDMADVSATLSTCQDDATRVAGDDRVVASERGMRLVADVPRETSLRMAARVCPRGGPQWRDHAVQMLSPPHGTGFTLITPMAKSCRSYDRQPLRSVAAIGGNHRAPPRRDETSRDRKQGGRYPPSIGTSAAS